MILRLVLHFSLIGFAIFMAPEEQVETQSAHDFTKSGWSRNDSCKVCHAPGSESAVNATPLWDESPSALARYKLYDGSEATPNAASLNCLSCHDGGIATDVFGGSHDLDSGPFKTTGPSVTQRTGDLRGTHPIGVDYPQFNRRYHPKTQVESDGYVVIPDGRVECISCHDVHGQYGVEKLLVKSNDRSALCLTCHRK